MTSHMTASAAFATLELESSASHAEVKSRYKQLALRQHPDKNPNDPHATRRFQELGDAYNHLNRYFERGGEEEEDEYSSSPFDSFSFGSSPFGRGPFGFPFGGRSPFAGFDDAGQCNCSACRRERDNDSDDDDDLDFFKFVFEEVMRDRGPPRSYQKQKREDNESPEAYRERLRKFGADQAAATERRAREEVERKERRKAEQEREATIAAQRRKDRAAEKVAARESEVRQAESKVQAALRERQRIRSAVFTAARAGDAVAVRKGVYEDSVDAAGPEALPNSPVEIKSKDALLHIAVAKQDLDLVSWLIDHSAEPEDRDSQDRTVFHAALAHGASKIVRYLLEAFSPPTDYETLYTPPTKPKTSVIHLAVQSCNADCVWAVLDAGLVEMDDIDASWMWMAKQCQRYPQNQSRWQPVKEALLDIEGWKPPKEESAAPKPQPKPQSPSPSLSNNDVDGSSTGSAQKKKNRKPPQKKQINVPLNSSTPNISNTNTNAPKSSPRPRNPPSSNTTKPNPNTRPPPKAPNAPVPPTAPKAPVNVQSKPNVPTNAQAPPPAKKRRPPKKNNKNLPATSASAPRPIPA